MEREKGWRGGGHCPVIMVLTFHFDLSNNSYLPRQPVTEVVQLVIQVDAFSYMVMA